MAQKARDNLRHLVLQGDVGQAVQDVDEDAALQQHPATSAQAPAPGLPYRCSSVPCPGVHTLKHETFVKCPET